ncbi:MAG: YkgJ family cysteine cluster protein, partial [Chloroflexota bacterium]|nr:YkgJ family cysteine cluster protein [Chloroflexota bacterium]
MSKMEDFESFKEKILRDYPRLSVEDNFKFACHPGVPCFGKCCANVNIFLTPYDVLRMKTALGISSTEFLEKYTIPLSLEENQLPVILLKMAEDAEKKCPFVSDEGCTIYNDRPWSCRMYPLGLASSKTGTG